MTAKSARKGRADSVAGLVDAAMAAAKPDIEPPDHITLRETDRPFWTAVVHARARKEWNDIDLAHAANLARCQADIERLCAELQVEGDTVENARGTSIVNPKHALLEVLSRRAVSLTKLLQVQPAASGKLEGKIGARESERKAREAAASVKDEEDLLA